MGPVFLTVPTLIKGIIDRVIVREGGYVDDPDDPGGATNMGITFATLEKWRDKRIVKSEVKRLDRAEAIQIYYQMYWTQIGLENIDDWWSREFIFDWVVNAGFKNPIRNLQRLVNVKADGVLGPVTGRALAQYLALHGVRGYGYITDCRVRWYIRLVETKHTRIKFLEGWFNRANHLRYAAPPFRNRN